MEQQNGQALQKNRRVGADNERVKEMKTTKKKWLIVILITVIAAMFIGYALLYDSDYSVSGADVNTENEALPEYVEIQKQMIDLNSELGENTPYPQIYMIAETLFKIKGVKQDIAVTQAADRYIERKALVWYAEKSGIHVTHEEVNRYIEELIQAAKGAENYNEVNEAYKKAGITLEQYYRKNIQFYRDDYLIGKLYNQWIHDCGSGDEVSESEMELLDEAWQEKVSEIKNSYQSVREYKKLKPLIAESKKIYRNGAADTLEYLKKADIFIEEK